MTDITRISKVETAARGGVFPSNTSTQKVGRFSKGEPANEAALKTSQKTIALSPVISQTFKEKGKVLLSSVLGGDLKSFMRHVKEASIEGEKETARVRLQKRMTETFRLFRVEKNKQKQLKVLGEEKRAEEYKKTEIKFSRALIHHALSLKQQALENFQKDAFKEQPISSNL